MARARAIILFMVSYRPRTTEKKCDTLCSSRGRSLEVRPGVARAMTEAFARPSDAEDGLPPSSSSLSTEPPRPPRPSLPCACRNARCRRCLT